MIKSALLLAPLTLMVACSGEVSNMGPDSPASHPREPTKPDDANPDKPLQIAGKYAVSSNFDLSNSPELKEDVANALLSLRELSSNPGGTLVTILDESGHLDFLPDFGKKLALKKLEDKLNDVIKEHVGDNNPSAKKVLETADMIANMLTDFSVLSEMQIQEADAAGNALAEHKLTGFSFFDGEEDTMIDAPEGTETIAKDVSLNVAKGADGGTVEIGDHSFALPLGGAVVDGYHSLLQEQFGNEDLGELLEELVDCASIAKEIGDFDLGIATITTDDIQDVCVLGLDELSRQLDKKLRDIEFAKLNWNAGTGKAPDAKGTIGEFFGDWDTTLTLKSGSEGFAVPSIFEAERLK